MSLPCGYDVLDLRHERVDIRATIGVPLVVSLAFVDADTGLPYDLTGVTLDAGLITLGGLPVSLDPWTVTVTDAVNGEADLSMTAATSEDDLGLGSWTWWTSMAIGVADPIYVVGGTLSIHSVASFGDTDDPIITVGIRGVITVAVSAIVGVSEVSDHELALLVEDEDSETYAALTAWPDNYVDAQRRSQVAPSVRFVNIGDSIGSGDSFTFGGSGVIQKGTSYTSVAEMLLGGRFMHVGNFAAPGETSSSRLAAFDANIPAMDPGIVLVAVGANDYPNGISLATFKTNIQSFVTKIRALGAIPLLGTVTPRLVAYAGHVHVLNMNAYLREYAREQGIGLVDFHAAVTNPATGEYFSDYNQDDLHPSQWGYKKMAAVLASVMRQWLPLTPGWDLATVNNGSDGNLIRNPLALGPAHNGLPLHWSPSPLLPSASMVASTIPDPLLPGANKVRFELTGATGILHGVFFDDLVGAPPTPGQRMRLSGKITVEGNITVVISARAIAGSPTSWGEIRVSGPVSNLPFSVEHVFTGSSPRVSFWGAPGTGAFEVSQPKWERLAPNVVVDDFNRANNASVVGGPDIGPSAPTIVAGTWGIISNTLYPVTAAVGDMLVWETGVIDHEITFTWPVVPVGFRLAGPVLAYTDANNFYRWELSDTTNANWRLTKKTAGVDTVPYSGSNPQPLIAAGETVTVGIKTLTGGSRLLYLWTSASNQPADILQYVDTSPLAGGTKAGFRMSNAGGGALRLDGLRINPSVFGDT